MFNFTKTKEYLLFTIFVVIPLTGVLAAGNPVLAGILLLTQVPFVVVRLNKLFEIEAEFYVNK